METSEKPKIFFTVATVHVPRYGELIASEKRALPRLQKELNEANQLKMESHRTMMSRHRKRKQEVHMEYRALAACQEYDDELGDETFDK